jgi:deoxycytidylate deaminase
MKFLSGDEEKDAKKFLEDAQGAAKNSTCLRAKCGSVIVKDGKIIGRGFNSPPFGLDSQRRCENQKDQYHRKVTDKTCCVHAEQRVIMDALRNSPKGLAGSRLYFVRLGPDGKKAPSGKPYCTICSKMALDAGISEFVLWHRGGICVYGTEEYNDLSFGYTEPSD